MADLHAPKSFDSKTAEREKKLKKLDKVWF